MTDPSQHQPSGQYREFFERSADAILILDGETFIECNQATLDMLRYSSREDLLQTHPSELSPEFQPDGRSSFDKANEMIAKAFAEGSHRFEWSHKRADGEVFPVEVLLTAVPRGDRMLLHTVWRDITDRKRLEEELRQAQKMEAIGRLTGAIAHDFNNLLVAIIGHAELLEMSLDARSKLMEHVTEIQKAGSRAATLVQHLLAFSRKQVLRPKVLDLNEVFTGLARMFGQLLGENIRISTRLADQPLPVMADPGQLEQVILNLATNARDAMPLGGKLTFTTEMLTVDTPRHIGTAQLNAGRYAMLAVIDTGTGMNEKTLANIFEPFFTTKARGEGTGLGLSTVYGIVKQNDGDVSVQTEEGQGTTFRVYLPLTIEPAEPHPHQSEAAAALLAGTETILLVEDEPAVAGVIETVLRNNGYTVHRADNGEAALELIDKEQLTFDLLLTDVVMPRMGGPELAAHLRAERPQLKVIFTSGYSSSSLTHSGRLKEGVNLIQKPFTSPDLLAWLRRVLDESK